MLDRRDCLHRIEENVSLRTVADVRIEEEGVDLGVNIFHHDLEAVKTSSFCDLHVGSKMFHKILVDNTIGCCEECEYARQEAPFIAGKFVVPMRQIVGEVDLFCHPIASLRGFV